MDEQWKAKVDSENKKCNEARIVLQEHEKSQQKEIDDHSDLISELYDYKNKIFQKITVLEVEKKFLPYLVMILSACATIGMFVWTILKAGGG